MVCNKCKIEKEQDEMRKNRKVCKSCYNEHAREYNKTTVNKRKELYITNKEYYQKNYKEYYQKNSNEIKEKSKQYYQNNKDKAKEVRKQYYLANKETINSKQKEYAKNKYSNNILFKLSKNIRFLIWHSFKNKGYKKNSKTNNILGCSFEDFKLHLENLFIGDMCWENYGTYWDIDHIIPISSANNEEEVIKLNHYTNLQPLDSYTNRHIKRNKIM